MKPKSLSKNDRQVRDREKDQRRYCGNRRCKHGKNIGIGRDDGVDRVCGDRYRSADHEQHPRIPRTPLSGERDDGNGSDDDDSVHNERPRPRLRRRDARRVGEIRESGERQPERTDSDEHGADYRGPYGNPS